MDHRQRIASLWSWLPAFRAVAETEQLPTASKRLHVSPSALSRTIHLLEDQIGVPLFHRVGRRIELNRNGAHLLAHVRDAMRFVASGLELIDSANLSGAVHVASDGVSSYFAFRAFDRLKNTHPGLVPCLHGLPDDGPALLLRGSLDVILTELPVRAEGVDVVSVGQARSSIYCAASHPLAQEPTPSLAEVAREPFVAPIETPQFTDGWPLSQPRRIGLRVRELRMAVDCCLSGEYLAVLPDVAVVAHPAPELFHRLPVEFEHAYRLYAMQRILLGQRSAADQVVRVVGEVMLEGEQ